MKANLQNKNRKKEFSHNQYWALHFTEILDGEILGNYRTIIKARSANLAKEILINRMKEDGDVKVISILTYYIHKNYKNLSRASVESAVDTWEHVRKIAFPNEFNKLFKLKKERAYEHGFPMGRGDAHKKMSPERKAKAIARLKKSTDKKRGCCLPRSPEAKKKYGEKTFVPLSDPVFKKMEISFLKKLMKDNGGNRTYCSEKLGISTGTFKVVLDKFPEIDWKKDYPLVYQKPRVKNTEAQRLGHIKATATLKARGHKYFNFKDPKKVKKKMEKRKRKTWDEKKAKRLARIKPLFLKALRENNFHQENTGKAFGMGMNWANDVIKYYIETDSEFKKEFETVKDEKRIENSRKARREKRMEYLKSCKHEVFEAYHQNQKSYTKAARYLNMNRDTFSRLFKEIQEKVP